MLRYHMRLSILGLSIDMNHLPNTPVIITIAQDLHIFSAFCVFVMLKVLNLDYSGINVPLVAVCNVPPVARCNVPPQKWLQ